MKTAKAILTVALLAFVATTFALIAWRQFARPKTDAGCSRVTATNGLALVYFHTDAVCTTCRNQKAWGREAAAEWSSEGNPAVRFLAVNFQEAAAAPCRKRFDLGANTLLVAEVRDGQIARHRKLHRIWDLADDRAAYAAYVRRELTDFAEGP